MNRQARRHPETLRARELAERLGVSEWLVYDAARNGALPAGLEPLRVGRLLLWPKARVDAVLGPGDDEGPDLEPEPVVVPIPTTATAEEDRDVSV